jgi:hypothetical protein
MIIFILQPHLSWKQNPGNKLTGRWVEFSGRFEQIEEENILLPPLGIELRFLVRVARSLVTIPPELF